MGGILPILLIGGAAYFLLSSGALGSLGSMFGGAQPAVPGYTPIGGTYYRNTATGQTVQRLPSGQMVTASGVVAPSGVPNWLQPTVQAGAAAIPVVGIGLVTGLTQAITGGVRSLFGGSSVTATPAPDGTAAPSSVPVAEAPGAGYVPTLPADVAVTPPDYAAMIPVAEPPGVGYVPPAMTMDLSLAPVDTTAWSAVPSLPADVAPPAFF